MLQRHEKITHERIIYSSPYCDYKTSKMHGTKTDLDKHMSIVHNIKVLGPAESKSEDSEKFRFD